MRCFLGLTVSLSVLVLTKAQYDGQDPQGNAYYDNEAPHAQYDGLKQPPPPPPRQNNEQFNRPQYNQNQPQYNQNQPQYNQNQGQYNHQEPLNNFRIRTTTPLPNDTFTLPEYYHSITTTKRTIKINRRTYAQQLDTILKDGALKTPRVIEAFSKVDRGYFVHPLEDEPYGFMARKLGRGVFMEKPHMQAKVVELLEPKLKEGAKVLEVGSGTGFLSCVFSELVGQSGRVLALEHMKDMCEESYDTVASVRPDLVHDGRLQIRCKDGRVGHLAQAPYDAIYFAPYVSEVPYSVLLQLKPGGRLLCGVGKGRTFQRMVIVDRSEDGLSFHKYDVGAENFINPLINADDQNDNWLYQQSRRRIVEAKQQGFSGMPLAKKLRLFTRKPVDFRKIEDDGYKFIEV